ncbi:MAG: hypothetical protein PHR60_08135 [Eubacteriales bacterium]|nr:hypothetical protein [Eubacteriales bacterium]
MKEGFNMHYPYDLFESYPPDRKLPPFEGNLNEPLTQPVQNTQQIPTVPLPGGPVSPINIPPMPMAPPMGPAVPPAAAPTEQVVPAQEAPAEPIQRTLVQTVEFEGPGMPFGASLLPTVVPEPPHFSVPGNPLLPEQYKEIISYENLQYLNGFMRTQIGKECLVTIAIGASGTLASRKGYLIGVGINYIILIDSCSEDITVLDFYSIRLIEFYGKRCPVKLFI